MSLSLPSWSSFFHITPRNRRRFLCMYRQVLDHDFCFRHIRTKDQLQPAAGRIYPYENFLVTWSTTEFSSFHAQEFFFPLPLIACTDILELIRSAWLDVCKYSVTKREPSPKEVLPFGGEIHRMYVSTSCIPILIFHCHHHCRGHQIQKSNNEP